MDAQARQSSDSDPGNPYTNSLQNVAPQTFSGSAHQVLNQALVRQNFQNNHHRLSSGSPSNSPILSQNDLQFVSSPQTHAGPSNTRSPLHQFSIPLPEGDLDAVATAKRKQVDGGTGGPVKRRRDVEENGDDHENHENGLGAKHWTDEEKTRLFNWLMAPDQDDHWSSLRAAKNSCLRECAAEVFGNKKTYQALKGCYERNFNVFRQIYAYQTFSEQLGPIEARSDGDRIREYERRLQEARKTGCDVGGVNARTIDHWHRSGWYNLFYERWHGDPATTARVVPRHAHSASARGEEADGDEDLSFDPTLSNGPRPQRTQSGSFGAQNHISARDPLLSDPNTMRANDSTSDQPPVNVTFPQNMMTACIQFLHAQSQQAAQKMEYMRKREEREERESKQRKEADRVREEREAAEWEFKKQSADVTQKSKLATELLGNPVVDPSVKQAAGDYLKRLFTTD